MFAGKLVAGLIGLLTGGPIGLLVGVVIGHFFDRGLSQVFMLGNPEQMRKIQSEFFKICFELLGRVAKADGRVSEEEIAHAEQVMQQLGVVDDQRQQAIAHFKHGSSSDYLVTPAIHAFLEASRGNRQLPNTLLVFLISMALADGELDAAEQSELQSLAQLLGFNTQRFQRLLQMVIAQSHFQQAGGRGAPSGADLLSDAYRALGVTETVSDRELKRAYRKLMSEHHPDKLMAKGVPEEMIKLATEKSQEIQAAYETVKKSRGIPR